MYDSPVLEGSFEQFDAPDVVLSFEQDSKLRIEIEKMMSSQGLRGGALNLEEKKAPQNIKHSRSRRTGAALLFLGSKYKNFRIVAMSCSALDIESLYKLGIVIRKAAGNLGRRICIIASGDMSHKVNDNSPYGACPEGSQFDNLVSEGIILGDIPALLSIDSELRDKAAECGYRSLVIMCGAFDGQKPQTQLLSFEAPFGIGYCVSKFLPSDEAAESAFDKVFKKNNRSNENPYVNIARTTLETYIKEKTVSKAEMFSEYNKDDNLFHKRAGVFVSIKKFGELRGCIGTTGPTTSCIAEEIISNAVSAGTRDPRFNPVEAKGSLIFSIIAWMCCPSPVPRPPATLRARGLRVRYGESGPWVLDGVDLDLAPGRKLAVVGRSGAGKSTLAEVLLRFLPYQEGSVTLDGVPIDALAGDELRRLVGLVSQDAHVFDTSLEENVRLSRHGDRRGPARSPAPRGPAGLDRVPPRRPADPGGTQRGRDLRRPAPAPGRGPGAVGRLPRTGGR